MILLTFPSTSILGARARVALASLRHREAWTLRPSLSRMLIRYLARARPTWKDGTAELNAYSPPVTGEGYGRYLSGLKRLVRGETVPLLAHVSVTDRCGYRCTRCSNVSSGRPDPSAGDLERLLDGLRAAGTARVAITGGEPLLREDLSGIVEMCAPDLAPLLFTSGLGLDTRRAKELRDAGLAAAFISLDSPAAHDSARGQAGAFDAAVAAIRAALEAGIYTAAQTVVGPELLAGGAMADFLELCRGLHVDEVMLLEPVAVGGRAGPWEPGEEDRRELAALHLRAASDASLPKVSCMSFLEGPDFLGCQAGFSFLYVGAGGDVFPCDFAPLSFGNAFEVGVPEVLSRLSTLIPAPSRQCLARRGGARTDANRILPWIETREALGGYDPGDPPGLMGFLRHVRSRPS